MTLVREKLKAAQRTRLFRLAVILQLGLFVPLVGLLIAAWVWDGPVESSSLTSVLVAFFLSSLLLFALPHDRQSPLGTRHRPVPSLSHGAVWLLAFIDIVMALMMPRFVDRYAELEEARLCARVTTAAVQNSSRPASRYRNIQCRAGR